MYFKCILTADEKNQLPTSTNYYIKPSSRLLDVTAFQKQFASIILKVCKHDFLSFQMNTIYMNLLHIIILPSFMYWYYLHSNNESAF